MFVESILSSKGGDVYSVATSATIAELIDTLAKHNIGAVLVLDDLRCWDEAHDGRRMRAPMFKLYA